MHRPFSPLNAENIGCNTLQLLSSLEIVLSIGLSASHQLPVAPRCNLGLMYSYKGQPPFCKVGAILKGHLNSRTFGRIDFGLNCSHMVVKHCSAVTSSSQSVKKISVQTLEPDRLGSFPDLAITMGPWKSLTFSMARFPHGVLARIKWANARSSTLNSTWLRANTELTAVITQLPRIQPSSESLWPSLSDHFLLAYFKTLFLYFFLFFVCFFAFIIYFNWRIITSQYFDSFCHTCYLHF